jgi:hypothetical protein
MPFGKASVVGHRADRAIRRDESDDAGPKFLDGEFEADVVDVNRASPVDDDVVAKGVAMRQVAKVGVLRQRSILLPSQELLTGAIDDQQPPVRKVLDAHRKRRDAGHDIAASCGVEAQDFVRAPVRQPEHAVAPAWRLGKHEPVGHNARLVLSFEDRVLLGLHFPPEPAMIARLAIASPARNRARG